MSETVTQTVEQEPYTEMMARYLGPTVIQAFANDDVTEIYVNPHEGRVHFDTRSQGRIQSEVHIDADRREMFLNAVASSLDVTLGPDHPRIEAELPTCAFRGSRLQGFVRPVTPSPAFNIRKRPTAIYSLDTYVTERMLTASQRLELRRAIRERRNILIAGGTNSGKTTLANALLKEITDLFPRERIVILEDTVELQCAGIDHLALRSCPAASLEQLLKSALRTSPNRIVVGEVRGAEALQLLDAWATGHPGGVATVHASSAAGALSRLDRLAQRANVPPQRELIAETVHLIVVIEGGSTGRRITDLVTVTGLDERGRFLLRRQSGEAIH